MFNINCLVLITVLWLCREHLFVGNTYLRIPGFEVGKLFSNNSEKKICLYCTCHFSESLRWVQLFFKVHPKLHHKSLRPFLSSLWQYFSLFHLLWGALIVCICVRFHDKIDGHDLEARDQVHSLHPLRAQYKFTHWKHSKSIEVCRLLIRIFVLLRTSQAYKIFFTFPESRNCNIISLLFKSKFVKTCNKGSQYI